MGRPLRARPPYPGHSAAHPLNQQGQCSVPQGQEKTRVLVIGITGKVGGATAEHLLAHGKELRALVRNREKAANWANQGVELVDGDWNDSAAIEQALKGVEGAFVMLPHARCLGALARIQRSKGRD
jgi:NAD(P)-dependent dehydrogenase (short-subunit alcohol dehydrogenase family)